MSEKISNKEVGAHEIQTSPEVHEKIEIKNEIKNESERASTRQEHVENLSNKVEQAGAESSDDIRDRFNSEEDKSIKHVFTDRHSKKGSRDTYMYQIRAHLQGPSQTFSYLINNKSVDKASEAIGKTLFRPSGILAGAIVTLLGSIYYLVITHSTGFKYNFYVATLMFVGGFVTGLILEAIYRLFAGKKD